MVVLQDELSIDEFKESTRAFFVQQVEALAARGAVGVVLGCTEIELLELESRVSVPLYRWACRFVGVAACSLLVRSSPWLLLLLNTTQYHQVCGFAHSSCGACAGGAGGCSQLGAGSGRRWRNTAATFKATRRCGCYAGCHRGSGCGGSLVAVTKGRPVGVPLSCARG